MYLRLNASYHLSEANFLEKKLQKFSIQTLAKLTLDIFTAGRSKRIYTQNRNAIPFLGNIDILSINPKLNCNYVSEKYWKDKKSFLKEGMILTGRVGQNTVGAFTYGTKDMEGSIGSDNVIRIVNSNIVKTGFMFSYLASKYGYILSRKHISGNAQPFITESMLGSIPIPIFPPEKQQQIHDLIIYSAELRVQANKLLEEVENLMLAYLGISKGRYGKFQVSSRNINEVFRSFQKRIDAPAFINEGVNLIQDLKSKGYTFKSLKDCEAKVTRPGIFKRVYVKNNGLPYIKGSELGLNNPFSNCVYLSKSRTPFLDDLKLRVNQILITCAGSVGDIRLITKEFEDLNAIGSQDIIRIGCKQDELLTSEYIFAYLRLPFVHEFIQSLKYGSVIERIEPFHVDQIPVVIPSKEISKLVTERINKYKENIYSAFCQENQAIKLIEKEIDQWQN
jgi:restriction endonuclease S subunit